MVENTPRKGKVENWGAGGGGGGLSFLIFRLPQLGAESNLSAFKTKSPLSTC